MDRRGRHALGTPVLLAILLSIAGVARAQDETGACCLPEGMCQLLTEAACQLASGTWLGPGTGCEPDPCPPPSCVVGPDSLDFGVVLIGDSRDRTFTITNNGGGVLSGTVTESCPEFSVLGTQTYALGPGESRGFPVRFTPKDAGTHTCSIDPGVDCPVDVEATGVGELPPQCLVKPSALDFGTVAVDQAFDLPFTIENTGGGTISGQVTEDCAYYSIVGPDSYVLTAGQSQMFTVRFLPGAPGPANCTIETGCVDLPVTGAGAYPAQCDLDPAALDFGSVILGMSAERSLEITNLGELPLQGSVTSPCAELVILEGAEYDLGPGASQALRVRFTPSSLGAFACTLDAGTVPGPGTIACPEIPVSGWGVEAPRCELSATELDFGDVVLGADAVRTLVVTNAGGDTLRGTITVPCPEFVLEGDAEFELPQGAEHSVPIRFTPEETGAISCTLDVSSCGAVVARGRGIAPAECLVEPDTLQFGRVQIGESAERSFEIANAGDEPLTGTLTESCAEYEILGDPAFVLGPLESRVFTVRYTPTSEGASSCEIGTGELCVPVTALGTGLGPPICSVSRDSVDFGFVPIGESRREEVRIENAGGGVLEGTVSVTCAGFTLEAGDFEGTDLPYSLGAGGILTFLLVFTPAEGGAASCSIDLGSSCPPLQARGYGDPPPSCVLSTIRLEFGPVFLGETARESFTIRNGGGQTLEGEVTSACPELTIEGEATYALAAGESLSIAVIFAPTQAGDFACDLTLGSECDPVEGVGRGLRPPECAVSTELVDFGEIPIGQTAERSLTITNVGEGRLEGALLLDCASVYVVGDPGYALGPSESQGFVIEFAPLELGSIACEIEPGSGCPPVAVRGSARAPLGACCFPDGSCIAGSAADCGVAGGAYLGDGTACDLDACAVDGACCFADGHCETVDARDCARLGGIGWTEGATCDDAVCVPVGACCRPDGTCSVRSEADCARLGGNYQGDASACASDICPMLGACCYPDGGCETVEEGVCFESGGFRWTIATDCGSADCAPLGACCTGPGDCVVVTASECPGEYLGDGTRCGPVACLSVGACCDAAGRCSIVLEDACTETYLGDGVACTPDPCTPKVRAVTAQSNGDVAELRVETSSGLRDLEGWYRIGGETSFKQIAPFVQEGSLWVGAFDLADLNLRGIEYYLTYLDLDLGLRVSHGTADRPRRLPVSASATVPALEPLTLRMLSAPLEVEDPGSILGELRARFGEPDLRTWLLGRWDPGERRYRYLGVDETEAFVSGAGYFLVFATAQGPWSITGHTHFPVEGLSHLTLPLAPGWNMIGNPVGYGLGLDPERMLVHDEGATVTFATARAGGNPSVSDLYLYEPALPADDPTYPYRVTPPVLAPWEGCWIENRRERELVLSIPAVAVDPPGPSDPWTAGRDGWVTSFQAASASEAASVTLGALSGASNEIDSSDLFAPPQAPGARVHLSIEGAEPLLRDVRAFDGEITTWILMLELAEDVDLAWTAPTPLDLTTRQRLEAAGPWLFLREPLSGREIELSALGSIRLPAGSHRLAVENRLTAPDSDAIPGFTVEPNPTHEGALIRYAIAAAANVRLSVFDAAGGRVWTSESSQAPGTHAVLWNGQDERGERVPGGAYFVRLEADRDERTARVVVVR